jgi:hypothetical protein
MALLEERREDRRVPVGRTVVTAGSTSTVFAEMQVLGILHTNAWLLRPVAPRSHSGLPLAIISF